MEESEIRLTDGVLTEKAVHRLSDGLLVESVLMHYPARADSRERHTLCISSQAGCAVGCPFCATGELGMERDLETAEIVDQVYSIEINELLADRAGQLLKELGYDNIHVRCGDGYHGWPEQAPFDAILVAAAPDHVPETLVDQLAIGGRLIVPVGKYTQTLMLIEKREDGSITRRAVAPVAFVPMTGLADQH